MVTPKCTRVVLANQISHKSSPILAKLLYNERTMASNLRRTQRGFPAPAIPEPQRVRRIDDPELAHEIAARRERNSVLAVRSGLPAVGSRLVNRYGLEFVVEGHIHAPTANSIQRMRDGNQSEDDLYPSIIPQNLSKDLLGFVEAVDRCTTKELMVLDTLPHLRRGSGVPDGHWIDTISNKGANLLFTDAAQIHETHFAHEIGHLWVQYVEQAEDERVLEDVRDAGRLNQLAFVLSFVTDLRVNQVIAEKGFDVSVIRDDQAASVASLGRAIEAGYQPDTRREAVFMALALAAQIIEERIGTPASLNGTSAKVTGLDPELAQLSSDFADAVARHGYQDMVQVRSSIDKCLKLAFEFTGDGIDLEQDLVYPPDVDPPFEKNPEWLWGASPQMKCEVGRIMARESIPDGSTWSITQDQSGKNLLKFELPDGTLMGTWTLEHSQAFAAHTESIQQISEMNRQNRERQMKHSPTNGMPNFPGQPRRFYMAGTARFLTRVREAEWLGGEHPYAYALNNPTTYTDPSGLNPLMVCSDDCDDACDKFIDANPKWCGPLPSPPYPPGTKAWAFAFCCKGKPHHCYCPGMPPSPNPYIRACVGVHEHGHLLSGSCASGYTGPPKKWADECTALKAGIKCAAEQCRNMLSNDCIDLREWQCKECRRLKYACNPMPLKVG